MTHGIVGPPQDLIFPKDLWVSWEREEEEEDKIKLNTRQLVLFVLTFGALVLSEWLFSNPRLHINA